MKSWFTLPLVAFTLFSTESAEKVPYDWIIGADVVLTPPSPLPSDLNSVVWKQNNNFAVEWEKGNNITEFRHFKGQTYLNSSNGVLTLHKVTPLFSGAYTVEINGEGLTDVIQLNVMPGVPKPHISSSCNEEKTRCTLTCEGDVAGMASKPTYTWKFNNTEQESNQQFEITPGSTAPEFICELKNPVSLESSEPFANPFISPRNAEPPDNGGGGLKINSGLVVLVCLLTVVLAVVLAHRVKSGMWFFQKDSMPWQADFWQKTQSQDSPEPQPADEQPGERNSMLESHS